MYTGLRAELPLFLSDFNENLIFSAGFSKNTQTQNFVKNPSSWSRYVSRRRVEGQTDMTKLMVGISNFAKGPRKCTH